MSSWVEEVTHQHLFQRRIWLKEYITGYRAAFFFLSVLFLYFLFVCLSFLCGRRGSLLFCRWPLFILRFTVITLSHWLHHAVSERKTSHIPTVADVCVCSDGFSSTADDTKKKAYVCETSTPAHSSNQLFYFMPQDIWFLRKSGIRPIISSHFTQNGQMVIKGSSYEKPILSQWEEHFGWSGRRNPLAV